MSHRPLASAELSSGVVPEVSSVPVAQRSQLRGFAPDGLRTGLAPDGLREGLHPTVCAPGCRTVSAHCRQHGPTRAASMVSGVCPAPSAVAERSQPGGAQPRTGAVAPTDCAQGLPDGSPPRETRCRSRVPVFRHHGSLRPRRGSAGTTLAGSSMYRKRLGTNGFATRIGIHHLVVRRASFARGGCRSGRSATSSGVGP
jgi:hypothetical protein